MEFQIYWQMFIVSWNGWNSLQIVWYNISLVSVRLQYRSWVSLAVDWLVLDSIQLWTLRTVLTLLCSSFFVHFIYLLNIFFFWQYFLLHENRRGTSVITFCIPTCSRCFQTFFHFLFLFLKYFLAFGIIHHTTYTKQNPPF